MSQAIAQAAMPLCAPPSVASVMGLWDSQCSCKCVWSAEVKELGTGGGVWVGKNGLGSGGMGLVRSRSSQVLVGAVWTIVRRSGWRAGHTHRRCGMLGATLPQKHGLSG